MEVNVQISLGTGIDYTAVDDITSIDGDLLPMSNTEQLTDGTYLLTPDLLSYEGDGIPTGQVSIVPPVEPKSYPPEVGIWSAGISDGQGNIDWNFSITLSQAHTSALTVYADEVSIMACEITFYLSGAVVRTDQFTPSGKVIIDEQEATYDRIVFSVSKVDRPYSHVRITEVEFGASVVIPTSSIGGSIRLISEIDPLYQSIPLSELEFSLVNIEGDYDEDNPENKLDLVRMWSPINLSVTVKSSDARRTYPLGKYYIIDRSSTEETLEITAQDARVILQTTITPLELKTTESFGVLINRVLQDLHIPHFIDDDLLSKYPEKDITLDTQEWNLLTQFLYIQQYYGIYLTIDNLGAVHVSSSFDTARRNTLSERLLEYPRPSFGQTYNYISVHYLNGEYDLDLRPGDTEAKSAINVSNPLVYDEAGAKRVADRINANLFSQMYEIYAISDLSLKPGDTVPAIGKFTQDEPRDYKVIKVEHLYDGGLTMEVTCR